MLETLRSCFKGVLSAVKKVVFKPAVCGTVAAAVAAPTLVACYGPAPNYGRNVEFPTYSASVCNEKGYVKLVEPYLQKEDGTPVSIKPAESTDTSIACRAEDSSDVMMCRVARSKAYSEFVRAPEGCLENPACSDTRTCPATCQYDGKTEECNSGCVNNNGTISAMNWNRTTQAVVKQDCAQNEICVINGASAQCQAQSGSGDGDGSESESPQIDNADS